MRIEQFYPYPHGALADDLSRFRNAEIIWCQEEPKNMGAWTFIRDRIDAVLAEINHYHSQVNYVGRIEAASPATGLMKKHIAEQTALLNEGLTVPKTKPKRQTVITKLSKSKSTRKLRKKSVSKQSPHTSNGRRLS